MGGWGGGLEGGDIGGSPLDGKLVCEGLHRKLVCEGLHRKLVLLLRTESNKTRDGMPSDYRLAVQKRQRLFNADGTLLLSDLFLDPPPNPQSAPDNLSGESRDNHVEQIDVERTARKRVYLELGSGDGEWAVDSAKRARDLGVEGVVWVCVELRLDRAVAAHRRVVTNKMHNVLVVCADACALLERGLPGNSIAAIFVRFPQPPPRVVAARLAKGAWVGGGVDEGAGAEDEGADDHLLSRACLAHMWRVLLPKACLQILTDSLALARLVAATAACGGVDPSSGAGTGAGVGGGVPGANAKNHRARLTWVSERLCVRSSRDPTPSSDRHRKRARGRTGVSGEVSGVSAGRKRAGRGGREVSCDMSAREAVSGVEASGERMVVEEEVSGMVIYRMRESASNSFFGRMWQRGRAPNFLLRLRKCPGNVLRTPSSCTPWNRSGGECDGGGSSDGGRLIRAASVSSAAFYQ